MSSVVGGLLGGGGGSKTSANQKTEVNTQVDVNLSNIIDLSGIAAVFEQLKNVFLSNAASDETFKNALLQQNAENQEITKQQKTLLLLSTAVEAERNQEFANANKTLRAVAIGGGILAAWYILKR